MKENSIEKEIELLQDETNSLGLFFKCKGMEEYKIALEHILSYYKRVLKENEQLRKIKEISSNITEEDIDRAIKEAEKQYIPVQKVKDKIEELKQYKISLLKEDYAKKQKNFTSQNVLVCSAIRDISASGKIGILQELLEGRK